MPRTPIRPGEILADELEEIGSRAGDLAGLPEAPSSQILEILSGERSLTWDVACRLGEHFGTSAAFWMNLQTAYDLDVAKGRAE